MPEQALLALVGIGSALGTALVTNLVSIWREWFSDERKERLAGNKERFHNLYDPLYKFLSSGPPYAELDEERLARTLSGAEKILKPNLHLAPAELRQRISQWDEFIGLRMYDQLFDEISWLYEHVWETFGKLQKELKLA